MKTVYKYIIPPAAFGDGLYMDFPKQAQLLSVGQQGEDIVLWALVDTEEPPEGRFIRVIGTGHPIKPKFLQTSRNFIGTVQHSDGIVLHAFEEHQFDG